VNLISIVYPAWDRLRVLGVEAKRFVIGSSDARLRETADLQQQ